jgi:hypothetical protein
MINMSEQLSQNIINGDPAPLGLAGFAFTTFLLSFANSGIFGNPVTNTTSTGAYLVALVVALGFFYGGLAQFTAGIFEMRKGNTFGFTAFCSYGAFWLFIALFYILLGMSALGGAANFSALDAGNFTKALGISLIFWGIFTFYMWIPAMHLNLMLNLTFLLLWITFILLGVGNYMGNDGIISLGGFVGIATAVVAAYGSFAIVTNSVLGVKRFPLGFAVNILGKKS